MSRLTRSLCPLCLLQEIPPWLSCSARLSVILLEHTPFLLTAAIPSVPGKNDSEVLLTNRKRRHETHLASLMQVFDHHSCQSFLMMYLLVCQFDEQQLWDQQFTENSWHHMLHCTKSVLRLEEILEFDVHVGAGLKRDCLYLVCSRKELACLRCLLLVRLVDSTKTHKSLAVMSGRLPASGSFPQSLTNWETLQSRR